MQTKKCPKCGAEIPVEMSFCLHCMERTDGVLEIKRKAVPSRKYVIAAIVAFAVLLAAVTVLIFTLKGSGSNNEPEPIGPIETTSETATETSTESIQTETATQTDLTMQTQTSATAQTAENSTFTTTAKTANDSKNADLQQTESVIDTEQFADDEQPVVEQEHQSVDVEDVQNNETQEEVPNNEPVALSFEEVFTERMNAWGATHVLTDTLSFTENGCTFTSNVGTDKVNCTVAANADMTEYTLTIEPYNDYTRYSTSVYIPDIVNEMTAFVLDYRMSSSLRTDIANMFADFEADGHFSEGTLSCDITTQAHNSGAYPITVNCKITE